MSDKYEPYITTEDNLNLSVAWAKAFLAAIEPRKTDLSPLLIRVNDFSDNLIQEDAAIRRSVDKQLKQLSEQSCHTVANTIFPISLWNPKQCRQNLYDRYEHILPLIKKSCAANRYGVYFERLIAFSPKSEKSNQLEHILRTFCEKKNHRKSALQASIFDPLRDHTDQPIRGFPCLQQIIFTPMDNDRLAITGIYAKQYLFAKAYGNYLGLCRLGHFVAHELGMSLAQMNCYIADGEVEVPKNQINELIEELKTRLKDLREL